MVITAEPTDNDVQLLLNCTDLSPALSYDKKFSLKLVSTDLEGNESSHDVIIIHLPSAMIQSFENLLPSREYNISVIWYLPLPTTTECYLTTFFTDSSRLSLINTLVLPIYQ